MAEIDAEQELIDRLAEQFADQCRRGQCPSANDYAKRRPNVAEELREVLPPIALIEQLKRNRRPAALWRPTCAPNGSATTASSAK